MLMECELIFDGSTLSGSIFISRRRVKYLFMEMHACKTRTCRFCNP